MSSTPASYHVGNSPDAVSVQNVLLDPTSTLIMELAATSPGSGYDQLDISGLATLNGTLDVELLDGYTPSIGESFDIFSGPTTGSFAQINTARLAQRLSWNTSNLYTNGTISVVPEPSTLALLAAAAIGLAGLRLAATPSENCEASLRPARRPSHPVLPFAVVGERGTKGSLISAWAGDTLLTVHLGHRAAACCF